MNNYKGLLNNEFSTLTKENPYKVGLNEFFSFGKDTKNRINYGKDK